MAHGSFTAAGWTNQGKGASFFDIHGEIFDNRRCFAFLVAVLVAKGKVFETDITVQMVRVK